MQPMEATQFLTKLVPSPTSDCPFSPSSTYSVTSASFADNRNHFLLLWFPLCIEQQPINDASACFQFKHLQLSWVSLVKDDLNSTTLPLLYVSDAPHYKLQFCIAFPRIFKRLVFKLQNQNLFYSVISLIATDQFLIQTYESKPNRTLPMDTYVLCYYTCIGLAF